MGRWGRALGRGRGGTSRVKEREGAKDRGCLCTDYQGGCHGHLFCYLYLDMVCDLAAGLQKHVTDR
jgi:hypothetical protein